MKATDVDLARLALDHGWIPVECHDRFLAEADRCQALGLDKGVADILLEEGRLTAEQVRLLRDELGWTLRRPRIGDYDVIRRIGIGGMGTVFEARHVRLQTRVALKVLLPRNARVPGISGKFLGEARTLASLNHPHLVHAVDAGKDGEYYYLAMEFIDGENLLQRIARTGPLDPAASVAVIRDVCGALAALEEKGLVHRDIKPANILVGPGEQVKLADLGLHKVVDDAGGAPERFVCGTPHYISPEQVRRLEDLDIRSDLYSLGATWYHLVVGRPPFLGRTSGQVLSAHLSHPPPPPASLGRRLPASLERIMLRWLEKDRTARPSSSAEALVELAALERSLRRRRLLVPPLLRRRNSRRVVAALAVVVLGGAVASVLAPRGPRDAGVSRPAPVPEGAAQSSASSAQSPASSTQSPASSTPRPPAPSPSPASPPVESPIPAVEPVPVSAPIPDLDAVSPPEPGSPSPVFRPARRAIARELDLWRARGGAARVELERAAARFAPLARLARSFQAGFVALEPGRDPPAAIVLGWDFLRPEELDDFRSVPLGWEIREGGLACVDEAGPELDSVAWFTPPLEVEGELSSAGPLVVGFAGLRVAPADGSGASLWAADLRPNIVISRLPFASGRFRVGFFPGWVEVSGTGPTRRFETPVPERGRVVLRLGPGPSIRRLGVSGTLDPAWSGARVRLLGR